MMIPLMYKHFFVINDNQYSTESTEDGVNGKKIASPINIFKIADESSPSMRPSSNYQQLKDGL